ncbi:MAG: DUF2299 family protein [Desulfurococcales archaeon]|nr:DUF2299 family protein [Desulfurococcales archaeon]
MTSVKDKIVSWASQEDYEVHLESPPQNLPLEWIVRLTSKVPISANVVVQKPKDKDFLVISMGVMLSKDHYEGLSKMKEGERAELVYSIVRDLSCLCPDCTIIVQPSITDFQRLLATKTLYIEDLTREGFMSTVKLMVNILALLSLRLSTRFGPMPRTQRKPDESLGFI